MGLIGTVSSVLTTAGGDEDVFRYRCASCGVEFGLPKSRMVGVRCPDCRSMDVRVAE